MEELVLRPLGLTRSTFDQPTPEALTSQIAVPYIAGNELLADGPRVFVAAASGGMTTTPTDLARIMIAVQKAMAGKPQGRITPEIARAAIERQPGMTAPTACFPSSVAGKTACKSSWGLGFDVNLTKFYEHEPDGAPTGSFFGHSGLTLAISL